MSNQDETITVASPHTIKKFELIEKYVETLSLDEAKAKHLLNQYCSGLVFIDCMSNSGEYRDDSGNPIFGTPVRVARYLRGIAGQYPHKRIDLYFSDLWNVLDGEQWELEIRLTGRRVRNYSGSNAFPAYWDELKRTFQLYFKAPSDKYRVRFNNAGVFVKIAIFCQSENPVDEGRQDYRFVLSTLQFSVFIIHSLRQDFLNDY